MWGSLNSGAGSAVITFTFGLVGAILGALFNSYLGRKRDDRLREQEAKSIAAALYGEILSIRNNVADTSNVVANAYFEVGMRPKPHSKFDETLVERVSFEDPKLYHALASKIGLLPPRLILQLAEFHANYQTVRQWFPRLIERQDRGFTYSVNYLLRPAQRTVFDVRPALEYIERWLEIKSPAADPDMKKALQALNHEEDLSSPFPR